MTTKNQRRLTDDEQAELDALNAAVASAIQARREWLDVKMHETSRLQIGDDIYDLRASRRVGVVAELYRYWRDRDEGVRDTSVYCDYRYETGSRSFDNTSRQDTTFGTREDAVKALELRAELLREDI